MVEASNSPRVTNRLTEQIATARLAIELAEPRVAAAATVQKQADAAIKDTDDHAAEALAEVLHDYRNVLGIPDHNIVVRKRPGKAVPKVLPEICISQQDHSFDDGGVFSVDRLVVTSYAATADELARLDQGLLGLLNSAPDQMSAINAHGIRPGGTLAHFAASGIGNAAAIEKLDGGVRKHYVVDRFKGNLKTPRISAPLTAASAQSVGKNIAERAAKMTNAGLSAWVIPDSGKVIHDGSNRVVEVAVEARLAGPVHGLNGDGIGRLIVSGCPTVGTVIRGLGQVTSIEVVKTTGVSSTSCRLTIQVHAEALTA